MDQIYKDLTLCEIKKALILAVLKIRTILMNGDLYINFCYNLF